MSADLKDAAPQIVEKLTHFIPGNIKKASHTLSAYYLLSDTVRFFSTVTRRLVIK